MRSRLFQAVTVVTLTMMLTAALLAQPGGGTPVQADPPSGGPRSGKHGLPTPAMELERLAQTMQAAAVPLSETQSATILGILEDRATAMKALRKSGVTGEDAANEREKLMAASHASIRATLTEGQVRVFDAMPSGPPSGGDPPSGQSFLGGGGSSGSESLIDANTGGDPQSSAY